MVPRRLIASPPMYRRKLHALYVLSTLDLSKRKDASAMREIFKLAKELDLPIKKAPRHDLNLLSDSRPHQGLVLDCSPLQWGQLDAFPTAANIAAAAPGAPAPVWLALDEVMDPVGGPGRRMLAPRGTQYQPKPRHRYADTARVLIATTTGVSLSFPLLTPFRSKTLARWSAPRTALAPRASWPAAATVHRSRRQSARRAPACSRWARCTRARTWSRRSRRRWPTGGRCWARRQTASHSHAGASG